MKATGILISLLLVWQAGFSQWYDNFSDGDFITNPSWNGNATDFLVENNELKLNAPAVSAISYLSTNSDVLNSASWQFTVRMEFNPSSNNYAKVYLIADNSDLTGSLNGYFVKLGNTEDEVSLYRQDGLVAVEIIDGIDSRLDLSSVEVSVLVTRSATGTWSLSSILVSETEWVAEGSVVDDTYKSSAYFGVSCTYTSTRSTKFYFDDFIVTGDPYVDTDSPEVDTVYAGSSTGIQVQFNEEIDSESVTVFSNYLLNEQYQPIQVTPADSSVELTFDNQLPVINSITVKGVQDLVGNEMTKASFRFYYIDESPVQAGDIVINEIMADPAPTEDLPEIEYVELYNPTNKAINMTEWSYSDLSTSVLLPSTVLLPDSFLILCEASDIDLIRGYGTTVGLSTWPTLNNSTDRISLTNELVEIIDYVEYDDSWYDDELKRYGGWSLELIDPEVSCKGNGIWTASTNSRGGTPGSVNSVRTELSDDTPPTISEAFVLNSDSIIVQFSETLSEQLPQVVLEGGSVLSIDYTNWNFDEILVVVEPLAPRVIYNIVANTIVDCAGNINDQDSWQVVLPEPAEEGDVVISELLFNPSSTGVDFIEVYNSSPKHISLHNWTLDGEGSEKEIEISSLLKPNSYRVFTKQPSVVLDEYPYALEEAIFQQDIPLMSNSSGHVVLMNESQEVIDSVRYEEAWHFQYLASYDGVSLERINFFGPGYLSSNWASAASTENYATPGYENSQQSVDKTDGAVSVQPKVIVPDANGVDDFTTIGMSDDLAGSLVTITIYNIQGVPVKQVANNALVGATSSFNWDGTDKNGILVPLGHYIIMVESITNDARTAKYREKVVVATGF